MAIDTGALYYLVDPFVQWENVNGKPIVGGHVEVFEAGTDNKIITYADWDGTRHPFKIPLGSDGRAVILVDPGYRYDAYVYDSFNNLVCSRLNIIPLSDGDVTIDGMGQVYHDETLSGKGTPNSPLTVISGGKVYGGIYPIDVNNELDMISADNVPLGVQSPLYFAQDDDEGLVIALSSVPVPEGTMNESALGYQDGQITSYNGSAFSAGNSYEAGNYISIDNNTLSVTGLTPVPADTASTGLVAQVSADITAMIPDTSDMATQTWVNEQGFLTAHQDISNKLDTTAFSTVSGDFLTAIPDNYATKDYVSSGLSSKLDSTAFSTVSGNFLTAHQSLDGLMSADLLEISDNKITGYNGTAFAGQGGGVSGDFTLVEGNGIQLTDDPIAQTTTISVNGDYATNTQLQNISADITGMVPSIVDSNTISYSAKPTDNPIYASGNNLNNVNSIQGRSNLAIVPLNVLQVPEVITAAESTLFVKNAITATPSYLEVPNIITARANSDLQVHNVLTANPRGITAAGLSADSAYGLTANGLTADVINSGFSANGISAGKRGPLFIEGESESIYANNHTGFIFSSQNTAFGTAQLGIANGNSVVQMYAPKFEARNISGAGFSIEASGAKGYNESGNVVWDTNNPQAKNIISYSDTKTAVDGLNGNIILTERQSTNASNLTSSPYVIMDASQASYFAAYGPSAQTPTVRMEPSQIKFELQAGNTGRTTVGYNDVKQELSGSAWTLTGSIQKRELEYDANTSAITAIAGSAIGGEVTAKLDTTAFSDVSGSFLTAHQSLAGYLQDSDLGIENNKITAISGVELSAGDDLKTDNSLSGNGTLTSPLGVVPGYNETVLWSGNPVGTSAFTLSEKLSNFERFRFVGKTYNTPQEILYEAYCPPDGSNISYMFQDYVAGNDENPLQLWAGRFSTTNNLEYTIINWKWMCMRGNGSTWSNIWNDKTRLPLLTKVIGINRKAQ